MSANRQSRRHFSRRVTAALALGVLATARGAVAQAGAGSELSQSAESIHQEILIEASPALVYQVLTDPARFSAMTTFSMVPKAPPATIAPTVGGAFSLFGGHIEGRHVELVPGVRVVQAWRSADWPAGLYSIVRFELQPRDGKTLIVFDHTGFPAGQGQHLAEGWHANYWTPMRKYLASAGAPRQ